MGKRIKLGWSGGVNLLVDPADIRPDQLAGGKNCWPTVEGILSRREAVGSFDKFGSQTFLDGDYSVVSLVTPDPSTGVPYMLHAVDRAGGSQVLWAMTALPVSVLVDTIGAVDVTQGRHGKEFESPAQFVNIRGRVVVIVPGQSGYYQYTRGQLVPWRANLFTWEAALTGVTAAQSQSTAISPRVACTYKGRMVYGNMGTGFENVIIMSDRTPPVGWANMLEAPPWAIIGNDVLADNGRHIRFSAIQGERILAMQEISMASVTQPLQTALLILTDRSAIICTGEVSETGDSGTSYDSYLGDFQFAKVNYDCGIAGTFAICRGPNGTFWANGDEVWALYDGQPRPVPIGTNIRPALQECPPTLYMLWNMVYANGMLALSVATQDSVDQFQPAVNHWRLDLRPPGGNDVVARPSGPSEARWYGPQDYTAMAGFQSCALVTVKRSAKNVIVGPWLSGEAPDGLHFLASFNEEEGGRDIPLREVVSGLTWAPYHVTDNPVYAVGDVVMPTPASRNGRLYVATQLVLPFDAQAADFTVGQVVTGATSGAKGTLVSQVDAGASGYLVLSGLVGTFVDNEAITDPLGGDALVNGAMGQPGTNEPTWPGTGATVQDGGIIWTEITGSALYSLPNHLGTAAPMVTMEPDFQEMNLGTQAQDKVFKVADITAFSSLRQQVWLECAINGGNLQGFMGPAHIGDFTLGRYPAKNDLGTLKLDTSSVAEEYQARSLRPCQPLGRDRLPFYLPGVVRGRSIQPRFREGTGFIIDDTNDRIIACSVSPGGFQSVIQGEIEHGYYDDVPELMTAIVAALNTAGPLTGFTTAANPWSEDSCFDAPGYPYMTTLLLTFSARAANHVVGFLSMNHTEEVTTGGTTYYLLRSARLLGMLGYDTSEETNTAIGFTPQLGGVDVNLLLEKADVPLASPTRIEAVQAIPAYRVGAMKVAGIEGDFALKRGRPFSQSNRKS